MADRDDDSAAAARDVGGKMGESKGVWRILLVSLALAVAALAAAGLLYV